MRVFWISSRKQGSTTSCKECNSMLSTVASFSSVTRIQHRPVLYQLSSTRAYASKAEGPALPMFWMRFRTARAEPLRRMNLRYSSIGSDGQSFSRLQTSVGASARSRLQHQRTRLFVFSRLIPLLVARKPTAFLEIEPAHLASVGIAC